MRRTIAASLLCLQACSFVLVSGPPENHQQLPAFECTTSRVGPILDTVWTVLQSVNLVLAVSKDDTGWHDVYCSAGDTSCKPPISRGAAIPLYAVFATLGAAGMYFGYSRTGACRNAKAELVARETVQPGAAQPGTWPPPAAAPAQPPAPPAPAAPPAP